MFLVILHLIIQWSLQKIFKQWFITIFSFYAKNERLMGHSYSSNKFFCHLYFALLSYQLQLIHLFNWEGVLLVITLKLTLLLQPLPYLSVDKPWKGLIWAWSWPKRWKFQNDCAIKTRFFSSSEIQTKVL
jgi:hypothetical protein